MDFVGIARRLVAGRGSRVESARVIGETYGLVLSALKNSPFSVNLSPFSLAPDVNVGAIFTKSFGLAAAGGIILYNLALLASLGILAVTSLRYKNNI